MIYRLVLFALLWLCLVYLFNTVLARHFIRVNWRRALVYISTVALMGVFGEVLIDTLYAQLFRVPLWYYQILPVHQGYTSVYALILWGLYGFHMYLLHDNLNRFGIRKLHHRALIFAFEALVLELLVNLTSLLFFGKLIYFYVPSDLWHITTLQNFPFYLLAGYMIPIVLRRTLRDPWFFVCMNVSLALVFVLFT